MRKKNDCRAVLSGQEGRETGMLDGDDYPDYEGAILEEDEDSEYGDI